MLNLTMSVSGSVFVVWNLKSGCQLFILFGNGHSKMSISLPSLFVQHDGPATMGLNLRSLGSGISINSDFCVSTAFISLDL